jgi:hypothetical protein
MTDQSTRLFQAFRHLGLNDQEALLASQGGGINPNNPRTSFPGQPCGGNSYGSAVSTEDLLDILR